MSEETIKNAHLIHSYFVETTGIREVFEKLFKSYLISDEDLKLNRNEDADLIADIKAALECAFPKPKSTITPNLDELRYNAYWRLFGYTIKGKEAFPKAGSYNSEFNKTFEDIMYNIAQGILDLDITTEKVANPDALAMLLNDLRRQLLNRTYNEIENIASYWFAAFEMLRQLLQSDRLMVQRLGIRSTQVDRRLIELGEKLKVPVAKETMYLYELADRMHLFLRERVENIDWNTTEATKLYTDPGNVAFFKEIFNAWFKVTGKDFLAEALKARRRA